MKRIKKNVRKILNKIRESKGFSLVELLACTAIMLFATSVVTATMSLATQQYSNLVLQSEANMLNKTVSIALRDRLSGIVKYDDKNPANPSETLPASDYMYYSTMSGKLYHPFQIMVKNEDGSIVSAKDNKGELILKYYVTKKDDSGNITQEQVTYRLINTNAYADYGKGLKLSCDIEPDITPADGTINSFSVKITVFNSKDEEQSTSSFLVYPTSGKVRNVNG